MSKIKFEKGYALRKWEEYQQKQNTGKQPDKVDRYGNRSAAFKLGYKKFGLYLELQTLLEEHNINMNPQGAEYMVDATLTLSKPLFEQARRLSMPPLIYSKKNIAGVAEHYRLLLESPLIENSEQQIHELQYNTLDRCQHLVARKIDFI